MRLDVGKGVADEMYRATLLVCVLAVVLAVSPTLASAPALSAQELAAIMGGGFAVAVFGGDECWTGDAGCLEPDKKTFVAPVPNDEVVPGDHLYWDCVWCVQCAYVWAYQNTPCKPPIIEEGWTGFRRVCKVFDVPNGHAACPED